MNDGCAIPCVFPDLLLAANMRSKCAAGLRTWDFRARRLRQRDGEGVCNKNNTTHASHIRLAVQHSGPIIRTSHIPNRQIFLASSSLQHLRTAVGRQHCYSSYIHLCKSEEAAAVYTKAVCETEPRQYQSDKRGTPAAVLRKTQRAQS
jgi:hypothetical protein